MHDHPLPLRQNADFVQRLPASFGVHGQVGRPRGPRHMRPVQLPGHTHPPLVAMHRLLALHQIPFHRLVHRLHPLGHLFPRSHNGRRPRRMAVQLTQNLSGALHKKMMVLV